MERGWRSIIGGLGRSVQLPGRFHPAVNCQKRTRYQQCKRSLIKQLHETDEEASSRGCVVSSVCYTLAQSTSIPVCAARVRCARCHCHAARMTRSGSGILAKRARSSSSTLDLNRARHYSPFARRLYFSAWLGHAHASFPARATINASRQAYFAGERCVHLLAYSD